MALWKLLRGNRIELDSVEKHDGWIYFCTDDGSLFFDFTGADGNLHRKQINAKDAETLMGVSLEEIQATIPKKISELENDSNFLTEHSSLVLLTTPQTLTEEQKNQVKENLGITQGSENIDPVTTEYVYSYDGDNTSDANSWVLNYGGTKVFVKLGELPEGELNLIGSSIFRTNPNNQWLDRTFTITEEHLTKVLNKANTDIPATQDGLIQIYDLMASDFSEFTVLCICTKPGWYNVTFDDWYEIINFTETGIYGYDKRNYGGNDYLKTFTFSATVIPETGNGGG